LQASAHVVIVALTTEAALGNRAHTSRIFDATWAGPDAPRLLVDFLMNEHD
jgi:hypothetical protein